MNNNKYYRDSTLIYFFSLTHGQFSWIVFDFELDHLCIRRITWEELVRHELTLSNLVLSKGTWTDFRQDSSKSWAFQMICKNPASNGW